MHGITSALVTTTLVFMAVFVPVCFIGGVTGTFYTQFGLTMAIAVGISLFNALTLSPALCALIMRREEGKGKREENCRGPLRTGQTRRATPLQWRTPSPRW